MKEKENWYEYKNLRICEKGLQIESCRKCLFEVLCHYQKIQWVKNEKSEKELNISTKESND